MNKKLSKNFDITNITKIFEISKFISTFFEIFFICCFKNFDITNITKKSVISKFFDFFFLKNHRFGTMERTWYSDCIKQRRTCCSCSLQKHQHYTNLNCCHLHDRHISPLSILAIKSKPDRPIIIYIVSGGSGGSRTLVFNPFLILSTSCALREQRDSNPRPFD